MTTLEILNSIVLLLLTVSVVGLFAKVGELSGRRTDPSPEPATHKALKISTPSSGEIITDWPGGLVIEGAALTHLLIVSTTCHSCAQLLSGESGALPTTGNVGVVLIARTQEEGIDFISRFASIRELPGYVDVKGAWSFTTLGIDSTPALVTLAGGRITSAANFGSAEVLADLMRE